MEKECVLKQTEILYFFTLYYNHEATLKLISICLKPVRGLTLHSGYYHIYISFDVFIIIVY